MGVATGRWKTGTETNRLEELDTRLHLSVRELLEQLEGIGETALLHHDGGKGHPRTQRLLTDINDTQQRLYDLFEPGHYAPTR